MRIVYLVRDPISRLLSHYTHDVWERERIPFRPFDDLMNDLEDPGNIPVWSSRYATQLERWLERFDEQQVLVLDAATLSRDDSRAATMSRLFAFLDVDPEYTSSRWSERHNTAEQHRVLRPAFQRLGRRAQAAAQSRPLRRLSTAPIRKPKLSPEQERRLRELLRPEVRRLRDLTGLKLDHWTL
jgi:hypothetical protein